MAVRFGVIGVGAMGSIHSEHLASRVDGARLVAVADVNIATAQSVAERLGIASVYADHGTLLANPEIDAIVIATPRATHARIAKDAAAAGKHIFCEKPLAATLEEIDEVATAVNKAGVALQVGFHRRFDASFRHVREAIAQGEIGEVRIVHSISRDPVWGSSSRLPEDLLLETTIHDFDMVRHASGSEIIELGANGLKAKETGRLEGVIVVIRLASGATATIDNHVASAYGYDQRLEVFGTYAMASVANVPTHTASVTGSEGSVSGPPLHFFAERYGPAYIAELASFVQCVERGTAPTIGLEDARAAQVASFAALESLREGRPVSLKRR